MQEYVDIIVIAKHYVALLFVSFAASQLPSIRRAADGVRFRLNIWRFLMSVAFVLLVEGFVKERVPRFVYLISFVIAFYSEEIYDYMRNTLFKRLKKKFEDQFFSEKNDEKN